MQATGTANEEGVAITRSGRASRPHDFKRNFPGAGFFYQGNVSNNQND